MQSIPSRFSDPSQALSIASGEDQRGDHQIAASELPLLHHVDLLPNRGRQSGQTEAFSISL
jgi:hypothetical protein